MKARLAVGSGTGTCVGSVAEVSPWVRAFWAERFFPSGVRGPVECWALRRLRSATSVVRGPSSVVVAKGVAELVVSSGGKAMLDISYPLCKNRGYPNTVRTIGQGKSCWVGEILWVRRDDASECGRGINSNGLTSFQPDVLAVVVIFTRSQQPYERQEVRRQLVHALAFGIVPIHRDDWPWMLIAKLESDQRAATATAE